MPAVFAEGGSTGLLGERGTVSPVDHITVTALRASMRLFPSFCMVCAVFCPLALIRVTVCGGLRATGRQSAQLVAGSAPAGAQAAVAQRLCRQHAEQVE